jgi:hypothetical protein
MNRRITQKKMTGLKLKICISNIFPTKKMKPLSLAGYRHIEVMKQDVRMVG